MKRLFLILLLIVSNNLLSQTQIGSSFNGISTYENLGSAVAISANGNIIVIAAPERQIGGISKGQVSVYYRNGSDWIPMGTPFDGEISYERIGAAVALSADGQRVSFSNRPAPGDGDLISTVRIYDYNGSDWVQTGYLSGTAIGDNYGGALSFSGDGNRLAIGIAGYGEIFTNAGAAVREIMVT